MNDKISNGEIYRLVLKIDTRLANMETEMNRRVTSLELWRAEISGKIAITVAVISVIASIIISWIKDKVGIR